LQVARLILGPLKTSGERGTADRDHD
jgi:hypothetical protein